MKQQNEKHRENKPSSLLTPEQNDSVFNLLGRRCQTMSTAVIQLFTTEAPAHSAWVKRFSGIACFIKDSSKRSYFIRVYCMTKHELVWEEEMYESIIINKPREFLVSFEGQDCMIALSFASDVEANVFYKTATTTLANRSKRRRSRKLSPAQCESNNDRGYDGGVVLRKPTTGMQPFSQMPLSNAMGSDLRRDKKRPYRKLTKADISQPTDFKHIAHVGWNESKHIELNSEEVNTLDSFLKKAKVSEKDLEDRETRAYIYDFIQSHNVLDSVKSENQQESGPPPPVPSRNRTAPAPPSATNVTRPPPQLPSTKQTRGARPSRPPPIADSYFQQQQQQSPPPQPSIAANAPAPPPPPPPLPLSTLPSLQNATIQPIATPAPAPAEPDARSALMDSIRKGTTLRKVDPAALSTGSGGDARSELLSDIRQGVELRPVGDRELGTRDSNPRGTDALADALRRALEGRKKVLHLSDDDEEEDASDNDEWDD